MSAQIFIDAENVKPEIGLQAVKKFSGEYSINSVNIIGKEDAISSKYKEAGELYNVQNCYYGKNSADTWLCTEIAKTIFAEPEVEVIILISSDRDFLPAIKLATDKQKKVILVSDGNGHKNLKALLYDLRINPDLIELVDFRNELTALINPSAKKKGQDEPMENPPPKTLLIKLQKICATLPNNTKNFFINRAAQVKFIFVKHDDKLFEVPFIDGINATTFANVLRDFKIIDKKDAPDKVIGDSFLKVVDDQIFLRNEQEISQADSFDAVIDYFVDHSANTKTIFIKHGSDLREIPFVNGMPFEIFSKLLISYGISIDNVNTKQIILESFLDFKNDRVYFRGEEDFSDSNIDLDKLSEPAREFIKANEANLEFILVTHGNAKYEVPFIEGIAINIFSVMLRDLKILGKNAKVQKFLANNNFTVKDNLVYRNAK